MSKPTQKENFTLGQQLCHKGLTYSQVGKRLGTVNAAVWRGYDNEARVSRCSYANRHWNKSGSVKTTSDISTLF